MVIKKRTETLVKNELFILTTMKNITNILRQQQLQLLLREGANIACYEVDGCF